MQNLESAHQERLAKTPPHQSRFLPWIVSAMLVLVLTWLTWLFLADRHDQMAVSGAIASLATPLAILLTISMLLTAAKAWKLGA